MTGRHFDVHYREAATLADGSTVELRLMRPDDKALLRRGFERLSSESRYRRFFQQKDTLSDDEVKYLTEVDGEQHFAIGAVVRGDDGSEDGRAVARFVRLKERPNTAEAAIAVADEIHGKGLGRLLFQRLCAAAAERGVERLRCEVLAFNEPMRALLAELAPDAEVTENGTVMAIEFPVPAVPPDQTSEAAPRSSPLYRILVMTAQGLVKVRRAVDKLVGKELPPPVEPPKE